MSEETMLNLYKIKSGKSLNMCTPGGTMIRFVNGHCATNDEGIIEYLEELIRTKQLGVYVDPDEPEISSLNLTPEQRMYKRIEAQVRADIAKANKPAQVENSVSKQTALQQNAFSTKDAINPTVAEVTAGQQVATAKPVQVNGETGEVNAPEAPASTKVVNPAAALAAKKGN